MSEQELRDEIKRLRQARARRLCATAVSVDPTTRPHEPESEDDLPPAAHE